MAKEHSVPKVVNAHEHLREDLLLEHLVRPVAILCDHVVAIGNLKSPLYMAGQAAGYLRKIKELESSFEGRVHVAIMLVRASVPILIIGALSKGFNHFKILPEGSSTNSQAGILLHEMPGLYRCFEAISKYAPHFSQAPPVVHVHMELTVDPKTGDNIPNREREVRGIEYVDTAAREFPSILFVIEHASDRRTIHYVETGPANIIASIAPHYAYITEKDVFGLDGKLTNIHLFCRPTAKTERDLQAVRRAICSRNSRFIFGPDSAAHFAFVKERDRLPGLYTELVMLPLLAGIFSPDRDGQLNTDDFVNFTSRFATKHFGLKPSGETITLVQEKWKVPVMYKGIRVFKGGETLNWKVKELEGLF